MRNAKSAKKEAEQKLKDAEIRLSGLKDEIEKIKEILNGYSQEVYFMNATKLSLDEFNSNQQVNLIMLGFALATNKIPFIEIEYYEEVIKEWLRDPDKNIKAAPRYIKAPINNTAERPKLKARIAATTDATTDILPFTAHIHGTISGCSCSTTIKPKGNGKPICSAFV